MKNKYCLQTKLLHYLVLNCSFKRCTMIQTYFPKYMQLSGVTRLGEFCGPGFRTLFPENRILPCPFWKPLETRNEVGLEFCFFAALGVSLFDCLFPCRLLVADILLRHSCFGESTGSLSFQA
ncbi:unnamed protein product [Rangifer tarandus platyrhynchus]|uniref:Uncharacterized protein n=1 Tax=Rangifer tarandus platyrhynchus TaxID=3082113 RepID=A0AC59Y572_RANTA